MNAARTLLRPAAAIVLGVATAMATVPLAWATARSIRDSSDILLLRGEDAWHGNERRDALVRWINLETVGPLATPAPEAVGAVPAWAEPAPPVVRAQRVRSGAVAVGWPLPVACARWRAERGDEGFPPTVENETSGDTPKEAVHRLVTGDPHAVRALLPVGIAVDAAVFAVPWMAVFEGVAFVRRRRTGSGVTPRE